MLLTLLSPIAMAYNCKKLDKSERILICQNANQGNAESQFNMGRMYHFDNKGVIRDIRTAMQWYQKVADQGHTTAQLSLGVIYDIGTLGYRVQNYQMAGE